MRWPITAKRLTTIAAKNTTTAKNQSRLIPSPRCAEATNKMNVSDALTHDIHLCIALSRRNSTNDRSLKSAIQLHHPVTAEASRFFWLSPRYSSRIARVAMMAAKTHRILLSIFLNLICPLVQCQWRTPRIVRARSRPIAVDAAASLGFPSFPSLITSSAQETSPFLVIIARVVYASDYNCTALRGPWEEASLSSQMALARAAAELFDERRGNI